MTVVTYVILALIAASAGAFKRDFKIELGLVRAGIVQRHNLEGAFNRAEIGNDHANLVFGNVKRLRQFTAHAKRSLRSSPDRELISVPFGDGRARLERCVRNILHGVGLFEFFVGCR